jgi:hypothetical protein
MTYYLVLFSVPPVADKGAIKLKITRRMYLEICDTDGPVIDSGKGTFEILTKRIFAIEEDNAAFIICDAKKSKNE